MNDEDMDVVLVVTDAILQQGTELREVRREVSELLVEEAWRTVMCCYHYLTTQCLNAPGESAWVTLN
ncbi:hypothetical protein GN958_ATG22419 [Phytophthora infestans]|uniref:Uncharacterized protein n=1 Tax=Phytophthora infestans TaxID=4787 RepID=A0A8S9TJH5_PHYIN|nr:hypothetical protein GN958_ATG22419 [Phytophthora infestans]